MKPNLFRLQKSPMMVATGFIIWAALIWKYEACFIPLFNMVDSSVAKLIVAFAVFWINIVWFYGIFHFVGILFSKYSKPIPTINSFRIQESENVAILYTTRNDFYWEAAESCLNQDYPFFTFFILDDSTNSEKQGQVKEFLNKYGDRCRLIHRKDTTGYKAGNLNHALSKLSGDYKYFAVVDADEVLPKNFLSKMVPYFRIDENIGFIQANHRYRKAGISKFSSSMSKDVNLHWDLFLPARNKYGFVMFYGHGAVIRTDVWKKAGGFPTIVSEDIGFAVRSRELGFHGLFLKDVVAEEAFPNNYPGFLRREIKVVKGSLQFMTGHAGSFFASNNVTVTEKLDLIASISVLFLPAIFMCFLIAANIILPILIASHELTVQMTGGIREWGWFYNTEAFAAKIRELWSWDFYLVTLITIIAPLFYQMNTLRRSPGRMLRYAAQSTAIFLSIIPALVWETVSYLLNRQVEFVPTGDSATSRIGGKSKRELFSAGFGLLLFVFSLLTWNLALLTVALSFMLHPILLRIGWNSSGLRIATLLPFLFFISVFGSIPLLLIGTSGMLTVIMPAHH